MRRIVARASDSAAFDRRKFMNGGWGAAAAGPIAEIASILVQTRPDRLGRAAQAIEALPGTQIYGRDPKGKLIVVIEASDVGAIGATLNIISLLPDVLTAALVFHCTDEE